MAVYNSSFTGSEIDARLTAVGTEFVASNAYPVGSLTLKNGVLYQKTSGNTTESWNASHWTQVSLSDVGGVDATLTVEGIPADAKATGDEIAELNTAMSEGNIACLWNGGYVRYSDGVIVPSDHLNEYCYTNLIPVNEGESYDYAGYGSSSVWIVSGYDASENLVSSFGVRGIDTVAQKGTLKIPEGIAYVRICTNPKSYGVWRRNTSINNVYDHVGEVVTGQNIVNAFPWSDGFVKASDGSIQNGSGTYSYSPLIKVTPGERYIFSATASSGVLLCAMYSDKSSNANLQYSVKGTEGSLTTKEIIVPFGINYIRISTNTSLFDSASLKKIEKEWQNEYANIEKRNIVSGLPIIPYKWVNGNATGEGVGFFSIENIPVEPNTKYYIWADGRVKESNSRKDARFITAFDENGNVIGSTAYVVDTYITPALTNHLTISYLTYGDFLGGSVADATGFYYFSKYPINENIGYYMNPVKIGYKTIGNSEIFYERERKATINFSFDDGVEEDSQLYEIFKNHGARCGFALIGWVLNDIRLQEYRKYYNEGFSILCHSNNGEQMGTETDYNAETLKTKMWWAKTQIERSGIEISGWVTPSSYLKPDYLPTLRKYYNYGYTKYFGTYPGTGAVPYNTIDTHPTELKRVHIATTTIENLKLAVDQTIQNGGYLSFYGHGYEITQAGLDVTKLEELIEYILEKEYNGDCHLYAPDEAFIYYYRPRMSDLT